MPAPARAKPGDTEFWTKDKKQHFAVNFVMAGAGYTILRKYQYGRWESLVTSIALAALVSTAKEIYDREVDPGDIQADFLGAGLGGGVFFTVDVLFF